MEEQIFNIIVHGGNARGFAYEALEACRKGEYEKVDELLKQSKDEMVLAHNTQTELVQKDVRGESVEISLLMIHAQDQLMTTMSEQTLIEQMIIMQKEINELREK
ncbi:PTS lactose/cellobiose transporter subunit IIA [Vagococcus teuberi]|uniref:PTS mannose transporter subunit IIA n=1 Tax=Vagococcus teuberi TaxID=519472 RepID=A0A1J0A3P4_9ENTE|nr:PTS lactose/cellobiose transporter subunit IIA [Vagococcus teuberi]APB30548.1 PTS mannose transporter subunit IIA [Vagococcus teuberi]